MPKGKPIDPQLKTEIVSKIRNDGMSVSAASAQYGVNAKSIYYWLRDGVVDGNRNLILENNKLKKELEIAYRIIGRFTARSQRPKRLAVLEEVEPGWRDKFARTLNVCRTSYYRTAGPRAAERQGCRYAARSTRRASVLWRP